MYNERTYPLFTRLLAELGVATQPSEMSFSVSCARTRLEYSGGSLRGALRAAAQPAAASRSYGIARATSLRFNREAPALLGRPDAKPHARRVARPARGYGEAFVDAASGADGRGDLVGTPGAGCSSSRPSAFVRFFANHGLLQLRDRPQWRCVTRRLGGATSSALVAPLRDRVHLR